MRALVTGATGFIGGRLVNRLLDDGWTVSALVRDPNKASSLAGRGVELIQGDLTQPETFKRAMKNVDTLFHFAAYFVIGGTDREMAFKTNVEGTEEMLRAGAEAGVGHIVYCSSVAALGRGPHGSVADETQSHSGRFPSVYEESKWAAHQVAHRIAAKGAPVVTVMPGAVYGPGDPSFLARMLVLVSKHHIPIFAFRRSMVSWVHVDDVVDGVMRARDKGRFGEDYILAGENETIEGLLRRIGAITGVRPPRLWFPRGGVRATLPLGSLISRALGAPPGAMRDVFNTLDGSIAFSSAKAEHDLGYHYRSIEEGFGPYLTNL